LPQYAPHLRIFGTDISEAMLDKAKKRVTELGLKNVEGLAVMDAEKTRISDNSFDVVMAQYVVTRRANPEKAPRRIRPACVRPGGELIILTRVSADAGMRRFIEQRLQHGGSSARFPHRRILLVALRAVALRRTRIELAERRLVPPLGHFSLVRFRKIEATAAVAVNAGCPASSRRCIRSYVIIMMSHAGHRIPVNSTRKNFGKTK